MVTVKETMNGSDSHAFNSGFKNIFASQTLQNYFNELIYSPKEDLSKEEIERTGLLKTGDRFSSNDYISGKYKDISFKRSDIHIEEKYLDKNRERWDTLFRGRWMVFDFNKSFKSNIQVISSRFPVYSLCWVRKSSKIEMEDIGFNESFSVYSEIEHDAFYVLTPHFVGKLKKIYRELGCGIMFGFMENKLYVVINNNEDSFEYNVLKKSMKKR